MHTPLDLALAPPRAFGPALGNASLRNSPEDFRVDEQLAFAADGGTAHWLVCLEKRGVTTLAAVGALSRYAGVSERDIGFAGFKDRHAVTSQHFTVPVRPPKAGPAPSWAEDALGEPFRVLSALPHARKLPRGALAGNRFTVVARGLTSSVSRAAVEERLAHIAKRGVPNYFGEQRYGRGASNLAAVEAWAAGGELPGRREERGFVLSAARSLLFNAALAARVEAGNWDVLLPGDLANLDGSRSRFKVTELDDTLRERLATFDIHPTGTLAGSGETGLLGEGAALEQAAWAALPLPWGAVPAVLVAAGMEVDTRPLRLPVRELTWSWGEDAAGAVLTLQFRLPAGGYATTVLRELFDTGYVAEDGG